MKVAICLSGLTRCHTNALSSIDTYFKDHEVDVFCHTYHINDLNKVVRDTWSKEATQKYYENVKETTDEILKLFNPSEYSIEDYDFVSNLFTFMFLDIMNTPDMFMENIYGNLTIISMHYSIMVSNMLRKHHQEKTGKTYDAVFRMRYDSHILDMSPLEQYDMTRINIPFGRDWSGINDQFAFGPPDLMDKYMSLFPDLVSVAKSCLRYHGETILLNHLKNHDCLDKVLRPLMNVLISISREEKTDDTNIPQG